MIILHYIKLKPYAKRGRRGPDNRRLPVTRIHYTAYFYYFQEGIFHMQQPEAEGLFSVAAYPSDCGVCSSVEMVQMIYFGALKNEDEHLAE